MTSPVHVPVLVVGAGPAGLATAIQLARHGVRSLLVEQRHAHSDLPRATVLSVRTMELLRSWGLHDAIVAGGVGGRLAHARVPHARRGRRAAGASRSATRAARRARCSARARPSASRRTTSSPCCSSTCARSPRPRSRLGTALEHVERRPPAASPPRSATSPRARSSACARTGSSPPTARAAPSATALGIAMHGATRCSPATRRRSARPLWEVVGPHRHGIYSITHPGDARASSSRPASPTAGWSASSATATARPSGSRSSPGSARASPDLPGRGRPDRQLLRRRAARGALPRRPRLPRRRRRPPRDAARRDRAQRRLPGRLRPRLEARVGDQRLGGRAAARHLRGRAPAGGGAQRDALRRPDGHGAARPSRSCHVDLGGRIAHVWERRRASRRSTCSARASRSSPAPAASRWRAAAAQLRAPAPAHRAPRRADDGAGARHRRRTAARCSRGRTARRRACSRRARPRPPCARPWRRSPARRLRPVGTRNIPIAEAGPQVADVMLRDPRTVAPDTTVAEARAQFENPRVRLVLVADGERFLGAVTRDSLPADAPGDAPLGPIADGQRPARRARRPGLARDGRDRPPAGSTGSPSSTATRWSASSASTAGTATSASTADAGPGHRQRGPSRRSAHARAARRGLGVRRRRRARARPYTTVVGSIADRDVVRRCVEGVDAILHAATLHKPHVGSHARQEFVDVNVTGTLNLLEAAVEAGVASFVFTSTTSTFGRALVPRATASPRPGSPRTSCPCRGTSTARRRSPPRTSASSCTATTGCPCSILRTSRFFPEADDRDDVRAAYDGREPQGQRAALPPRRPPGRRRRAPARARPRAARSASAATSSAPRRRSPATTSPELRRDAPAVVERRVPGASGRATPRSAGACSPRSSASTSTTARGPSSAGRRATTSHTRSTALAAGEDFRSPLARAVGAKGYHAETTGVYTTRA